jgi:hypothetical protein
MAFSVKIQITPSGQDPVVLVDSPDDAPISAESLTDERSIQIAEIVRADDVQLYGRGNRRTTLEFQTSRQHASLSDAIAYAYEHPAEVPVEGLVEIIITDGATVRTYSGQGVIPAVQLVRRRGTTTTWRYRVIITGLQEVFP